MDNYSENGPERESSPHEKFADNFYQHLKSELSNILPDRQINTGYIRKGDRTVTKISFEDSDTELLSPQDWDTLTEFALVLYSDVIMKEENPDVTPQNTRITITENDPNFDHTQTITITHLTQE